MLNYKNPNKLFLIESCGTGMQLFQESNIEVIQRVTFSSDCTMLLQGDDEGNDGMLPDFLIYKDELYGDE